MDVDVDVLVVGAGPVGLTAAALLASRGCSVTIVERRDGPQRAPAAHVVNARTFEIWRQLGFDVDRIRAHAQDPRDAGFVRWVDRLGGNLLGSLPFERQGDDQLAITPTPLRNLSQHRLEPLLLDELARRDVTVDYSTTWIDATEASDCVTSTLAGPSGPRTVTSRWLLACDGAGSPVRKHAGIVPIGPSALQSFVMIHFGADLRPLVGAAPGVLFWICDPAVTGTFVQHDVAGEWVFMRPFDPATETLAAFDPARCDAIVRAAAVDGLAGIDVEIRTVASWTMSAQVAERYRAGRVLLAGDAAHRFPPTGGLGLNSGVQDVHNLVWKLAAVLHDDAPDALLDTYEAERRPVAQRNADVSLENAVRLVEVPVAVESGGDVAAAIADQHAHFDLVGLQLGYGYGAAHDATADPCAFRPSSVIGARLPHGWLRRPGADVSISSLDLVDYGHGAVFGGPDCERGDVTVRIGVDVSDPDGWWSETIGLGPADALRVRPDQHVAERWLARSAPVLTPG